MEAIVITRELSFAGMAHVPSLLGYVPIYRSYSFLIGHALVSFIGIRSPPHLAFERNPCPAYGIENLSSLDMVICSSVCAIRR